MTEEKRKYYKKIIFTGILFFIPFFLFSQPLKKSRILFFLDASSSMTYPWNASNTRFNVASNILLRIVDSIYSLNPEVEFAVRAYGTQFPANEKNCTDTRLEVPFNIQNVAQINTRLKNLKPIGFSPIAYSLRQSSENELNDASLYDYSIIFITDGGESCNGDVCNTFREFLAKKIKVTPYIIGLDKNEQLNLLYDCMGNYLKVTEASDIDAAIKTIVDANRPLLDKPKTLNITPVFAKPPVIKDTAKETVAVPLKKDIFPRLKMIPYKVKLKESIVLHPSYVIYKTKGPVKISFPSDEVKPAEIITKQTNVFPKLKLLPYKSSSLSKAKIIAQNATPPKSKTALLRFETEEPVVRSKDVFPKMKSIKYNFEKKDNPIKMTAKGIVPDKSRKAKLTFEVEEPVVRKTDVFKKMSMSKYYYSNDIVVFKNPKLLKYKKQSATLRFEVEEKKKLEMKAIVAMNYPKRYSYAYKLPPRKPVPKKGTAILRFSVAEPAVAKKKDSIAKPPKITTDETEHTVITENSNKTQVQIFFEGRNGKRYPTATPEILFKDVNTKGTVTSFRRQVNGNEPVPQNINPGNYNVVVAGYNDLFVNNVVITENKLNKVIIKVTDGTLSFAYVGNRSRPVEYNVIVNRRFAAGATVLQKATQRLPYEPGTYYVEISTLPASKFSIDMSFGALYELQIPEPGNVQFSNTNPVGNVQLLYDHNDKFEHFYTMNLNGNTSSQNLELQPGKYKVVFPVNPQMPQMGSKTVDFRIFSNQTTEVELK